MKDASFIGNTYGNRDKSGASPTRPIRIEKQGGGQGINGLGEEGKEGVRRDIPFIQ
jgi:hypothetical protein